MKRRLLHPAKLRVNFQHPVARANIPCLDGGKPPRFESERLSRRRVRLRDDSAPLGNGLLWGAVKGQGQSVRLRPDRRGKELPRKQQPSDAKFKFQHRARATGHPARGRARDQLRLRRWGWSSYALALELTYQQVTSPVEGPNQRAERGRAGL